MEIYQILRRLEKLERENRILKQAGCLMFILGCSVILMGELPSKTHEVVGSAFELNDSLGRIRAKLYMQGTSPQLVLYDENLKERVKLQETEDGPELWLLDKTGGVVNIGAHNGISVLALHSQDYSLLAGAGSERVSLAIRGGNNLAEMEIDNTGPSVNVEDSRGFQSTLGMAALETTGTGETHRTAASSLIMFDQNKKVLWRAP